jgi:hypothetical protein
MRQNASTANCHCKGRGEEEYLPYIFRIICLIGSGSANKLSVYIHRLLPVIYNYRLGERWQKAELTLMECCWYRYLRPFNGFRSFIFKWQYLNPRKKGYNFPIFSFSATDEGGRSVRFTRGEDLKSLGVSHSGSRRCSDENIPNPRRKWTQVVKLRG